MPGDGIGPELTEATLTVLTQIQDSFQIRLNIAKVEGGDRCAATREFLCLKIPLKP